MKIKLTTQMLKQMIMEEAARFGKEKSVEDAANEADEFEIGDEANTLAKKIDHVKALKIEEGRLVKRIKEVRRRLANLKK